MSNVTTYRGKLTQCLAQRRYSRSPLPFPFPLFSLTMHLERGKSQVFEFVKFSQVLTEELMSNCYYPFKSTFSCSMMKPPRPGPCLEELSRCFIKALVPSDAPLFQGVGWTHGSPMLVWLIDTFVLTHWHLQSRQSHLLRFWLEMETFTRCKISSSQEGSLKDHHIPRYQFSSLAQSCLTLCKPMNRSTRGLPVHHQLLESTQTHVHWVSDAIQPSHPLSSPSSPALSLSQHQGLFQWVSSSHQVAKVLEFQLQHKSLQWTPRTDLL